MATAIDHRAVHTLVLARLRRQALISCEEIEAALGVPRREALRLIGRAERAGLVEVWDFNEEVMRRASRPGPIEVRGFEEEVYCIFSTQEARRRGLVLIDKPLKGKQQAGPREKITPGDWMWAHYKDECPVRRTEADEQKDWRERRADQKGAVKSLAQHYLESDDAPPDRDKDAHEKRILPKERRTSWKWGDRERLFYCWTHVKHACWYKDRWLFCPWNWGRRKGASYHEVRMEIVACNRKRIKNWLWHLKWANPWSSHHEQFSWLTSQARPRIKRRPPRREEVEEPPPVDREPPSCPECDGMPFPELALEDPIVPQCVNGRCGLRHLAESRVVPIAIPALERDIDRYRRQCKAIADRDRAARRAETLHMLVCAIPCRIYTLVPVPKPAPQVVSSIPLERHSSPAVNESYTCAIRCRLDTLVWSSDEETAWRDIDTKPPEAAPFHYLQDLQRYRYPGMGGWVPIFRDPRQTANGFVRRPKPPGERKGLYWDRRFPYLRYRKVDQSSIWRQQIWVRDQKTQIRRRFVFMLNRRRCLGLQSASPKAWA